MLDRCQKSSLPKSEVLSVMALTKQRRLIMRACALLRLYLGLYIGISLVF
jgi:hypothetical protein